MAKICKRLKENFNAQKSYADMQIGAVLHLQKKYEESNRSLLDAYKYAKSLQYKEISNHDIVLFHTVGYLINNFSRLGLEDSMKVYVRDFVDVSEKIDELHLRKCYKNLRDHFKAVSNISLSEKYGLLYNSLNQEINNY